MSTCPAALNIEGEHFDCDLDAPHEPLAHSSRAAQAIWTHDRYALNPTLAAEADR